MQEIIKENTIKSYRAVRKVLDVPKKVRARIKRKIRSEFLSKSGATVAEYRRNWHERGSNG